MLNEKNWKSFNFHFNIVQTLIKLSSEPDSIDSESKKKSFKIEYKKERFFFLKKI
jgi:hypothetical protein